ncbi:MAG: ScpA family protein [Gammaproteobacteria bacterium]|nr:ScpA family protein [Gammaproteobacteria bacterium]
MNNAANANQMSMNQSPMNESPMNESEQPPAAATGASPAESPSPKSPAAPSPESPAAPPAGNRAEVLVNGEKFDQWPQDLYIPPDALEVFLETFQGPLDLLLYLIRRDNLDILDIPVAHITRQYMHYVELMRHLRLDLAAEYLVMAAMLAEIKSRMLLPRPVQAGDEEEEDPRAALVRRLRQYERFRDAARDLDARPRLERELYLVGAEFDRADAAAAPLPQASLADLAGAFRAVLERSEQYRNWTIGRETLSVREKMTRILARIRRHRFVRFEELLLGAEGRAGLVVNFMAVLELVRDRTIVAVQNAPFAPIHLKGVGGGDGDGDSDGESGDGGFDPGDGDFDSGDGVPGDGDGAGVPGDGAGVPGNDTVADNNENDPHP